MKKILIGIISLLLLVLCIVTLVKGIKIGNFKIESIKEIKQKSADLKNDLNTANDLTKKEYPSEIDKVNAAIKTLNKNKEDYENKVAGAEGVEGIGTTQIKTYKVEFLWTIIGNYANKEGVTLTLNVVEKSKQEKTYDLNFTLEGRYIGITDFIYDLENDEDLKFEIEDFAISASANGTTTTTTVADTTSNTNTSSSSSSSSGAYKYYAPKGDANTSTTNNTSTNTNKNTTKTVTTTSYDGKTLKATFNVEDVSIELN